MRMKFADVYDCLAMFEKWFDDKKKLAFLSALLIGFITHCSFFANLFMSPDGIVYSIMYSAGDFEISVGRWGLDFVDSIRADRSVSSVSSMLSILLAASGCVLLVDVLDFKKKISVFLTSAAIMVSPALAITLLYEYCSDAYLLAFFLAALSVFCVHRIKNRIAGVSLSAICLCGALSIYQNYMGVMIGTCIIIVIMDFFDEEKSTIDVVKSGMWKLAAIFAGGVLYYAVTKIICAVKGIEPNIYGGVDKISPASIILSLGTSAIEACRKFKQFFLNDTYIYNLKWYRDRMFMVFFFILFLCIIGLIIQKHIYKDRIRTVLLLLCLGLLPLGINAIFLIVPKSYLYALNSMQLMLVFPLMFGLLEKFEVKKFMLAKWGGLLVSLAILFTYYTAANYSYAYLELSYNQACAVAEKIVDRMQTTPGYDRGMPCAVAGILTDEYFPRDKAYTGYTICDIVEGPIFHGTYIDGVESWRKFILTYQGENMQFCDPVKYHEIVASEEFEEMGVFPAEDSVKIIDGVVVAKLTEDPPTL